MVSSWLDFLLPVLDVPALDPACNIFHGAIFIAP
jgi:hypothetical protein